MSGADRPSESGVVKMESISSRGNASPSSRFWSVPAGELLRQLRSNPEGLSGQEARDRLARFGENLLKPRKESDAPTLLLSQFKSPIILILVFATGLSFA